MFLTTRARYGVRALVDLAKNEMEGPVTIASISDRQQISQTYLEQLFKKLRAEGIVMSKPGPGGGYMLARSARDITAGDIIRCLEGPVAVVPCTNDAEKNCTMAETCPTKKLWGRLNEKIENFIDSVTIRELCDEAETAHGHDRPVS